MGEIQNFVFGGGYLVLGLVLIGVFIKVFLDYRRKWAEAPPTDRRRGQITRAAMGGLLASVLMAVLGLVIMLGGHIGFLGWTGLVVVVIAYGLLYPLSDERRFV
jgi:hypothetical protein